MDDSSTESGYMFPPTSQEEEYSSQTPGVITVVPRSESPSADRAGSPFVRSRGGVSRHHARILSKHLRSKSMTDVRIGQKGVEGLSLSLGDDTKLLPSCQGFRRKSPAAKGRSAGRSTTPDLARKDADDEPAADSNSVLVGQALGLDRSQSLNADQGKNHKRNKSDSGIVLDTYRGLSSSDGSEGLSWATSSSLGRCAPHNLSSSGLDAYKSASLTQSLPQMISETDSKRLQNSDYFLDKKSPSGRKKTHSESEISDTKSSRKVRHRDVFRVFAGSVKSLFRPRSLESLIRGRSRSPSPNLRLDCTRAATVDQEPPDWSPTHFCVSRSDSMEHLNYSESISVSKSDDNQDDDLLNVSWSSLGWRKSVRSRSSVSSDNSSENVFLSDSEPDSVQGTAASLYKAPKHQKVKQDKKAVGVGDFSSVQNSHASKSKAQKQFKDTHKSSATLRVLSTDQVSNDARNKTKKETVDHHVIHTNVVASDKLTEECDRSQSPSVLLPHLQRTLAAVRQHIKSKKTSNPSSKIPVSVKNKTSPRRRRSRLDSDERSGTNTSVSAVENVSSKRNLRPGLPSQKNTDGKQSHNSNDNAKARHPKSQASLSLPKENSNFTQQPKMLLSTAVTLDAPPTAIGDSSPKDGGNVYRAPTAVGDLDLCIFSPRPPRVEVSPSSPPPSSVSSMYSSSHTLHKSCRSESKNSLNAECSDTEPHELNEPARKEIGHSQNVDKSVFPRSDRNEKHTRHYKKKSTSRVEYLLKNDLFKKHLSGHIDAVEKNILRVKKFGLKKSFSNLDLNSNDTERLQAAFESSLKLQEFDLDSSFGDNSEHEHGEKPSDNDNSESEKISKPNNTSLLCVKSSKPPRRKSLACDDPSLRHLQEALRQGKPFSGFKARRGRMHIPSFHEFRRERQRTWGEGATASTEGSGDAENAMAMAYNPLGTITEDESFDIVKQGVDPGVSTGTREKATDEIDAYDISVSKETELEKSPKKPNLTQTASKSAMCTDSKQSAKKSNQDTSSQVNQRQASPYELKFLKTHQNLSLSLSPDAGSQKMTNHLDESSTYSSADSVPSIIVTKHTKQPCVMTASDDTKSENITNRSSSSSDNTIQENVSDGEIVMDDLKCDDDLSESGFHDDFPSLLFDESANGLDTEAWAKLFTQTHKPRRKEGSGNKNHHHHHHHHHQHHHHHARHKFKVEKPHVVPVLRSSSDVSGQTTNSGQKQRKRRLRKERPYKSDPLAEGAGGRLGGALGDRAAGRGAADTGVEDGGLLVLGVRRFLEKVQGDAGRDSHTASFPSLEELTEESCSENSESDDDDDRSQKRLSTASEDSGVMGQEVTTPDLPPGLLPFRPAESLLPIDMMNCLHCNPGELDSSQDSHKSLLCDKCTQRQQERKDTIYEIIETEISYGRDLRILKEEFYKPMQTTGLLTEDQLHSVFVNLDDLILINTQLTEKLRAAVHMAIKECDQQLCSVNIGSLFIESSTMFLAFENYCINQANASASLEQFERERELLKIFLQVSQAENGLLRRMHLKSFLMVPVQRIMKYPLLLNRLYKATPNHHVDKEDIRQAREKIEDILGHINAKAKGVGSMRIKRKQSELRRYSLTEKIEVNRVALEVLGWSKKEVSDLITSRMWYAQPADHTWAAKRCRNVKFTPVHAVLLAMGQNWNDNIGQQAAVVLVREKNGKYQTVREPFLLEKSVITVDPDCDEVFELQEWGREAFIFKADEPKETHAWVQLLRQQTHNLGHWRRRRNALPNIMLNNI